MDISHDNSATGQTMIEAQIEIRKLKQAISSHRGIICALVMFSAISVLTCTLLMASVVVSLTDIGISPSLVLLLCGGLNVIAGGFGYLCLKHLASVVPVSNPHDLSNSRGEVSASCQVR